MKFKTLIILITVILSTFNSCTQSDNVDKKTLNEFNFDAKSYIKNLNQVKSHINFSSVNSFYDYTNNFLNSKSNLLTEQDIENAESILNQLGVLDENISRNLIIQNSANYLFQENYISNDTKNLLINNIENIDSSIIQDYISSSNLSISEINFLNSLTYISDNYSEKSMGCWLLGATFGAVISVVSTASCGPCSLVAAPVATKMIADTCDAIANSDQL